MYGLIVFHCLETKRTLMFIKYVHENKMVYVPINVPIKYVRLK